ncbi:ABC transporter substrate-binding protein [Ideonella livida]|uniref:ABC transporter substrate-binding protein n=1 Tax=Ideonella livida TaxID=2707176 RepID=UPI001EF246E5|nr:ABC transporter substrate-binding protein [Ideonella livida]
MLPPLIRRPAGRASALARVVCGAACLVLSALPGASAATAPSTAAPVAASAPSAAAPAPRVLRYAFPTAETGFDPAQISDLYSRTIAAHIFEAPLTYDYLARPARLRPQTAAALPEASADFRTWTFRLRPGIYFADDPAFGGRRRELVAEDYVYSIKRLYDPRWKSPTLGLLEGSRILGLSELRQQAIQGQRPFDYDAPVEGLRVLDRYTFQLRLAEPAPRIHYYFADGAMLGAVAREVVEHYGDEIMAHPVGTGPFLLAQWRRSSRIVLARNPGFREERFDAEPPADDPVSQAIAQRLRGRRLPLLDRVEVSIVEESQPRLLGFLNAEHDLLDRLPPELSPPILPHGQLAPHLQKKGVQLERVAGVDITYAYFGMENPVVGGYGPAQVALRRAIALAYDAQAERQQMRKGQMLPAQSIVPPGVSGFQAGLRTEMSQQDLPRALALLDLYGFADRDGDGWRERPDGGPLHIEFSSQTDQISRQQQELWKKAFDALGLQATFRIAKWPEQLKASRAGKLMMWSVSWSAATPDGAYFLDLMYGPNKGQANHARFDLPEYNRLYRQQSSLPDGPQREAVILQMKKLGVAYMPYKVVGHRMINDLMHPWVIGYRRHPFLRENWRYVDVDPEAQARAGVAR